MLRVFLKLLIIQSIDTKYINQKGYSFPTPIILGVLIVLGIGTGMYYFSSKQTPIQQNNPVAVAAAQTSVSSPTPKDETADWKTYTNTKYAYSIKFPDSYEVSLQSEKEKSQLGVDANVCVRRKSDTTCLIVIDAYNNPSNLSLESYVNTNFKSLITGPLIPYQFNGYSSLFIKNHPGTDVFLIHNSNIYHINASTASSNKEIEDVVATFKFTTQTFKSEKGSFAIELPSDMKMLERAERIEGGATMGEVWFTFGQFDEHAPSGLVVVYAKPAIDGKGGACFDEKTGAGYTEEMIAGQKVTVCEISGFNAQYFTHPNKKIEYHISTARLSTEQSKAMGESVRKTLRFE